MENSHKIAHKNIVQMILILSLSILANIQCMEDSVKDHSMRMKLTDSKESICMDLIRDLCGPTFTQMEEGQTDTMQFTFSKELMPAYQFVLNLNSAYKISGFTKPTMHNGFYNAFKNKKFHISLTMDQLVELAVVLDSFSFEEAFINSISQIIIEQTGGAILDLKHVSVPPQLVISFIHYYFLLYRIQPMLKFELNLSKALRCSIRELIEHNHINLKEDVIIKPRKFTRNDKTITLYEIDLSGSNINDLDGLDLIFQVVHPSKIYSINLSGNFLSSLDPAHFKDCTNLMLLDLQLNLFSEHPGIPSNTHVQMNLLGNPCCFPNNFVKKSNGKK